MRNFHDVLVDILSGQARLAFEWKCNVLTNRERVEECAGLKNHRHSSPHFFEVLFLVIGDVLSINENTPRIRFQETHDVL